MKKVEVRLTVRAPQALILKSFADYAHAPILHKKYVQSVKIIEENGDISIAVWKLKVLGFWITSRQKQTVYFPDRLVNETIGGFAKGTIEVTLLKQTGEQTDIIDTIEVRVPGLLKPLEGIIAFYTRHLVTQILTDHKNQIEVANR